MQKVERKLNKSLRSEPGGKAVGAGERNRRREETAEGFERAWGFGVAAMRMSFRQTKGRPGQDGP